jgi:ABC-2 type transport system permease protein
MNGLLAAFWAEALKARRSRAIWLTVAGLLMLPLVGGLMMIILKDPVRAREMGLIGAKAQLGAGVADWPTFFGMLTQGIAIGGAIVFAMITTWVFGREFSDRTAKDLLALPTSRSAMVAAKFLLIAAWVLGLALLVFAAGLAMGNVVEIPGWSADLAWRSFGAFLFVALLDFILLPVVALFASTGRGYLAPLGWTFLSVFLAQIAAILGWGDWFPWSVPALFSGMAGPRAGDLGLHSYLAITSTFAAGLAATFLWWERADHTR